MNREVEIKLSADFGFELPDFATLAGLAVVRKPPKKTFTTYFDTHNYDLLSCGAALRFRGEDVERVGRPGIWTLKFAPPASASYMSSRFEYEVEADGASMPEMFAPALRVFGATTPLIELATLSAVRSATDFIARDGTPAFELDDDMVEVLTGPNSGRRFREIEVELLNPGFEHQAETLSEMLLVSGARYAASSSKLEQALENSETQAYISGLLERYEHFVASDLSVFGSLVLEVAGNSVYWRDELANAIVVGLSGASSRILVTWLVSKLAIDAVSLGVDIGGWLPGVIAELSVKLADELRGGGNLHGVAPQLPNSATQSLLDLVLARVVSMRSKGEAAVAECRALIADMELMSWSSLDVSEKVPEDFVKKWS